MVPGPLVITVSSLCLRDVLALIFGEVFGIFLIPSFVRLPTRSESNPETIIGDPQMMVMVFSFELQVVIVRTGPQPLNVG